MPRCLACLVVLSLLSLTWLPVKSDRAPAAQSPQTTARWPQWRGPSGQGYTNDANVPLTWSETENVLWKTKLPGRGNSSPIVWDDHIYLTAASPNGLERYVLCLSARDGRILWQQTASKGVPPGRTHGWNGYASASCVTDGERVYAFFGTPGLFCYSRDGKLLWKHSFGIFTTETGWGTAASPFLFEDLVIQNCDNDGSAALPRGHKATEAAPMALVALDKRTGKVRWLTPRDQGRGFSTPRLLAGPGGRSELLLNGPRGLWAYDPRSGKELWHCERFDPKESNKFGEPMPVGDAQMLYVFSGRPGPFQAVRPGGQGDVTKSGLLWQSRRRGRDVASPILWGDSIYMADNKATLARFDRKTGAVRATVRLASDAKVLASPIAVRGKLLFVLDTGETVVIEPGAKPKVVARNVLGTHRTLDFAGSPAVADGRLYLRSQSYLYCIGAKK